MTVIFLSGACHEVNAAVFQHLNAVSHIYGLLFQQKISSVHLSASQKTVALTLLAEGTVLSCFIFGDVV
jgi:hypothetical protein